MAVKQTTPGNYAPDGSTYVTLVDGVGNLTPVPTSTDIPSGATFVSNSVQGTTNAATATLPAAVGKTTYIRGFSIRGNATAAATGYATVTGVLGGTMSFNHFTAPLASGMGITEEQFTMAVPASTTNTAIAVASPAAGAGGTVSVAAWGYQL